MNTTQAPALTETQFKTAATVLLMIALSESGEVSEYAVRTHGGYVHMTALAALVRKGVLTKRLGDFTMPSGPYAGQVALNQAYYSVA